jgi:hypothetical protein
MGQQDVLEILSEVSMGDQVRIHPTTDSVSTPSFQPDDAFETTVKWIQEQENRRDSYFDENEGVTKRWDSREREIAFEPHPDDDEAEEYVAHYKRFADGHETGGGVSSRSYFVEDGQRYSSDSGGFGIEQIEVLG